VNTKQIVFDKPFSAKLVDVECPQPRENQVMVEIMFTTISNGTERANLIGDERVSIVKDFVVNFPRRVGYSGAGIVRSIGKKVTKVKVGDRVSCSWGMHQKMQLFPENCVEKIPDSIDFDEASIVHIATFPIAAIRKTRFEIGEKAMVMGLGILGMIALKQLNAAGASVLVAVDPNPERRKMALEFGADYAFDPMDDNFADNVKEVTGGGVNVAIEVTGMGKALDQTLDCMAKYGRVALLGCTRNPDVCIDYYRKVHGPGVSLIGAHTRARPDFESHSAYWTLEDDKNAIMRLIECGRLKLSDMVCEVHSPNDAEAVFKRLAEDKNFPVCVQFDWRML